MHYNTQLCLCEILVERAKTNKLYSNVLLYVRIRISRVCVHLYLSHTVPKVAAEFYSYSVQYRYHLYCTMVEVHVIVK